MMECHKARLKPVRPTSYFPLKSLRLNLCGSVEIWSKILTVRASSLKYRTFSHFKKFFRQFEIKRSSTCLITSCRLSLAEFKDKCVCKNKKALRITPIFLRVTVKLLKLFVKTCLYM